MLTALFIGCSKLESEETWNSVKQLAYFEEDKLKRYQDYEILNPEKDIKQIIIEVNIGLDKDFYTDIKPTQNLNSTTILVNKYNYLEKNYIPDDLVSINNMAKMSKVAANAFNEMVNNAKKEGYTIVGVSGYRSYIYQESLYKKYVAADGVEKADTYSARPGHSEHQTGLAIDVSNGKLSYTAFEKTEEFIWMIDNAHKYGFIMRYPDDKQQITGYMYEAWHYRYVGKEIANYIKKHNITYDEYYAKFLNH